MGQLRSVAGEASGDARWKRKTALSIADGAVEQLCQWFRAEPPMDHFPGGYCSGHRDRVWSVQGHGLIALGTIIGGCGPGGRHPTAVDAGDRAAGGVSQQDKGITTQSTRRHDGDRFGGGDGQGRIKGIATIMQDLETSAGGQWRVRTNHTAAAVYETSRQTVHGDRTSLCIF